MIRSIYIKNFIIIKELSIDFDSGFTVFTGETGAGKSILIDAISILIGGRATESVIKDGEDKAIIEGSFSINDSSKLIELEELGYDTDTLIVTKEISRNSKTTIRLNNRVVTNAFIKDLFENIIDIHNQQENQYLLDSKNHLMLLDNYLNNEKLLNDYKFIYKEYSTIKKELDEILNQKLSNDEFDYLTYQLQEIEKINVTENEDEEIEEKLNYYKNFERISSTLNNVIESFDNNNVLSTLYSSVNHLEELNNNTLNDLANKLKDHYFEVDDVFTQLSNYYSNLNFDENEYNALQARLFDINKLKRKYGSIPKILIEKSNIEQKLSIFEDKDRIITKKQKEIDAKEKELHILATELSNERKNAAVSLSKKILKELDDLELSNSLFEVQLTNTTYSSTGADKVEFYISTNVGKEVAPLVKVASGGEISRIMLGLKVVFNNLQGLSTVIFDEIDVGVSGSVANSIGQKMKQLSKDMQVFSITHLAPVASFANHHYYIYKTIVNNDTIANLQLLTYDERINELAKISSGSTSAKSLEMSKELLDSNQSVEV